MTMFGRLLVGLAAVLCGFSVTTARAGELRVAVAANFTGAFKVIAGHYQRASGVRVIPAFGSTGRHYAQIRNGAPFDLFLAADVRRPLLLEKEGIAVSGSRYTYALGRLVLWSPEPEMVDPAGKVLYRDDLHHIAIANPKLAPYGQAAREVLESIHLWALLQGKIVKGENISQTFQYVMTGNAEIGFIAFSQIKRPGVKTSGRYWQIPQSLYSPIEQQLVIIRESPPARDFWHYLKSEAAARLIHSFGYGNPVNR